MRLCLLLIASLALAGCESWPEVSTLPPEVEEEIRARDPRLEEVYERYHPVPGPGLHLKTGVRRVEDRHGRAIGVEGWVYVSGAW